MFKNKTLIIVGAGTSCEVGLPSSDELKGKIAELLDIQISDFSKLLRGDRLIYEALRILVKHSDGNRSDLAPYIKAALRIRDSMPLAPSIDNFIDAHNGDEFIERCGKLAIVRSILTAEKQSKLYFAK